MYVSCQEQAVALFHMYHYIHLLFHNPLPPKKKNPSL
jgi:hypothetical protein